MIEPKISFDEMVNEADAAITTLTPEQVLDRIEQSDVLLVDIRDVRELEREGRIPGSKHIPRGMLEFWIHPQSPYYKDYFDGANQIILHCNKGWRSALAGKALADLGIEVAHMQGGFTEWSEKGIPVEPYARK